MRKSFHNRVFRQQLYSFHEIAIQKSENALLSTKTFNSPSGFVGKPIFVSLPTSRLPSAGFLDRISLLCHRVVLVEFVGDIDAAGDKFLCALGEDIHARHTVQASLTPERVVL